MKKAYQQNQNISYIAGNIQSIFLHWFLQYFDDEYFKVIRFSTESDFVKFRGFMKEIVKQPKPFLVIDPEINLVDDSIYTTGYQSMNNSIDGIDIESKLYASEFLAGLSDESAEIYFRRSKYKFTFNTLMVESSVIKQFDLFNHIVNNFRNKSKFAIDRKVQNVIPTKYIDAIAKNIDMDYRSNEFIKKLNSYSNYPIIRKKTIKGDYIFFFIEDNYLQINIPDIPSKDSPETNNMIIDSARVTHIIEMEVVMPSEFILMLEPTSTSGSGKLAKIYSPDMMLFIPPFENINVDSPKMFNDKARVEQIDVVIENEDDYMVSIIDIFADPQIQEFIQPFIDAGTTLDFLDFKVYKNSQEFPLTYDPENLKIVLEPNLKEAYCIAAYLDLDQYNVFKAQYVSKLITPVITDVSNIK